jgi:hypothetical protein
MPKFVLHPEAEAWLQGEFGRNANDEPDSCKFQQTPQPGDRCWHDERKPCSLHDDCQDCPELAQACAEKTHPDVTRYLAGENLRAWCINGPDSRPADEDYDYEEEYKTVRRLIG